MNHKQTAEEYVRSKRPALMELSFGCEVEEIYWYKTETHKKKKQPDWKYSREGGDYGTVVKDLRSDFLPMWIDKGDQLEFQIQPNDIVSMKIIGHPIQLQDWLGVLGVDVARTDIDILVVSRNKKHVYFSLTTGQPATEADYKAFNEIVS